MKATHQPTNTPELDPLRPSALLRGAALYLGTHGWTQHQFYDFVANTNGPFPPACSSGAIISAATGRCPVNGIFTDVLSAYSEDEQTDAAVLAMRVFAGCLDLEYVSGFSHTSAIDIIGDWNDDASRTVGEVIESLTEAAANWDTIHYPGGVR